MLCGSFQITGKTVHWTGLPDELNSCKDSESFAAAKWIFYTQGTQKLFLWFISDRARPVT